MCVYSRTECSSSILKCKNDVLDECEIWKQLKRLPALAYQAVFCMSDTSRMFITFYLDDKMRESNYVKWATSFCFFSSPPSYFSKSNYKIFILNKRKRSGEKLMKSVIFLFSSFTTLPDLSPMKYETVGKTEVYQNTWRKRRKK